MSLAESLNKLAHQASECDRLVTLLHRLTLAVEESGGTTLSAIAEDTLVDYYERHKIQDRLLSKKEMERTKSPSRLKPL